MSVFIHTFPELAASQPGSELSIENDAVLRQYSLQRLMAYGLDYGDATRARAAAAQGAPWKESCVAIADSVLAMSQLDGISASPQSLSARERRASALLRMSQAMMLQDTAERALLYRRASELFESAGRRDGSCTRVEIDCSVGPAGRADQRLVGWLLLPPGGHAERVVLTMGGIEGWAMDFESSSRALVQRGIAVLVIDGPGQGESRLDKRVYLGAAWTQQLSRVLDHLQRNCGARSIGILGNSIGGNFAMQFASADARIAACCNNGGVRNPMAARARGSFFMKVQAFCDPEAGADAEAIWQTFEMTAERLQMRCPFLLTHGEDDPLVSQADSRVMFDWCSSLDKQMHVVAQGDHCIYSQPGSRMDLIGDWFLSRL